MKNYYEILGVSSQISNKKLRAKIIAIAEKCHPNAPSYNVEEPDEFIKAFIAFDVLLSSTNRLAIRRIQMAKDSGTPESEMVSELQILKAAEDNARLKSQSIAKMSIEDFKELYNPNFLENLFGFLFRLGR
jgi:DnaJ-class molecular chaperone